jgi:MerR family transcriptional regulator, copper efflux regulator
MEERDSATEHFSPKELAREAGVSTDTLRHYERKKVLPAPRRLINGYRRYPREALARVRLVRRALAVGFTLDELASILRERDGRRAPCKEVRALAAGKLDEVERRLEEMTALRDELRKMLHNWDGRLAVAAQGRQARLLDALAEEGAAGNGQPKRRALAWREPQSKRS